jgi:hypothetical protein
MTCKTKNYRNCNLSHTLIAAFIALGLVTAPGAFAQSLYVSQTGNDITTVTSDTNSVFLGESPVDTTSASAVAPTPSNSVESDGDTSSSASSSFLNQYLPVGVFVLGVALFDRSLNSGSNSYSSPTIATPALITAPSSTATNSVGTIGHSLKPEDQSASLVSWSFDNQSLTADGGLYAGDTITPTGLSNATPDGTAGVAFKTKGASGGATDYYLRAGIGTGGTNPTTNEGGYLQWSVSTVGYSGTTVSFYADNSSSSSGAFTTETLYYSTDGTNFTQAAAYTLTQSFVQYTTNVSSLNAAIDNNANAAFRIAFTGSTNYAGTGGPNARVDALNVSGNLASSPEPSGPVTILLGTGLLGLLTVYRRRLNTVAV